MREKDIGTRNSRRGVVVVGYSLGCQFYTHALPGGSRNIWKGETAASDAERAASARALSDMVGPSRSGAGLCRARGT